MVSSVFQLFLEFYDIFFSEINPQNREMSFTLTVLFLVHVVCHLVATLSDSRGTATQQRCTSLLFLFSFLWFLFAFREYIQNGDDFTLFPNEFWIFWLQDRWLFIFPINFWTINLKKCLCAISKDLGHHHSTEPGRDLFVSIPLSEHGLFIFGGRKSRQGPLLALLGIPSPRLQAVAYDIGTRNCFLVKHESNAKQASHTRTGAWLIGRVVSSNPCFY